METLTQGLSLFCLPQNASDSQAKGTRRAVYQNPLRFQQKSRHTMPALSLLQVMYGVNQTQYRVDSLCRGGALQNFAGWG